MCTPRLSLSLSVSGNYNPGWKTLKKTLANSGACKTTQQQGAKALYSSLRMHSWSLTCRPRHNFKSQDFHHPGPVRTSSRVTRVPFLPQKNYASFLTQPKTTDETRKQDIGSGSTPITHDRRGHTDTLPNATHAGRDASNSTAPPVGFAFVLRNHAEANHSAVLLYGMPCSSMPGSPALQHAQQRARNVKSHRPRVSQERYYARHSR